MTDCRYSLEQILCAEPQGIVSFVGAGGKTSLIFHLAHQLANSGRRVLTTTTTRIFFPTPDQSQTLLIDVDPAAILQQASSRLQTTNHITATALSLDNGKLQGFDPEVISIFRESELFDWILVEADGAARRSLKAPADHEPVIPPDTNVLVAVAGLDAIGEPLSEELVFRSTRAGAIMGLDIGETITESSLAHLFVHPMGLFKGAASGSRRFIFLNKADSAERRDSGARVAQILSRMELLPVEGVIVGQARGSLCVHALYHVRARP